MHFHALNQCTCRSFLSTDVDKHGKNKFTMLALEDVIFKVEVHIIHGLFLSATHFFKNMSVVEVFAPDRANRTEGIEAAQVQMRTPTKDISWARERVPMQFVFLAFYSKDDHQGSVATLKFKGINSLNVVLVGFMRDTESEIASYSGFPH